jgi:magnesium-transporting ATPase (P-type)
MQHDVTDYPSGLSNTEAARRLSKYGPNEPVVVRRFSALVQLRQLFANPLVVILLVAAAISQRLHAMG